MKLWDKGIATDPRMQRLTTGDDPIHDRELLRWDCIGSAAQARVLHKAGLLTEGETATLLSALQTLLNESDAGSIVIPPELEDAHTTIETLLTERVGDAGKKIHTGRSRNDQVITAVRLYLRDLALRWSERLLSIGSIFSERFEELGHLPMPGYTHLQPAMPSSVGMWLHAFLEGSLELARDGLSLYQAMNRNPLGASAGFGSSLPLDREYSASLLGFECAQRSFIDIQNSRGRYEEKVLFWGSQIAALFEKFAWDVELYCTREFGFLQLPDTLTTGSSIMPQKKNPDIVELLRARCGMARGYLAQLQWITGKLPSNYHRDLQLSKGPLFRGVEEIGDLFDSVELVARGFRCDTIRLEAAMHDELFATYAAYRRVKGGEPFRDAYRSTAEAVAKGSITRDGYDAELRVVLDEVTSYRKKSLVEHTTLSAAVRELSAAQEQVIAQLFSAPVRAE